MRRKSILWLIPVFLGFMSFVGIASQAEAFVFMDGDLKINGYIENQTAIRMEDQARDRGNDSGELSRCRTTMVLEGGLDLSESVKFNTILRGYYDAAWELDSGIIQKPREEEWAGPILGSDPARRPREEDGAAGRSRAPQGGGRRARRVDHRRSREEERPASGLGRPPPREEEKGRRPI